ncbi:uncharacterized protein N7503_011624 [Penicillium pulvis]|uniref:uncharacterized protein n=1 Tax=Penicillium pulvis TaxID=1562058 RepID=UPI002548AC20|nr:uncharacterized protein N7503_011624 [Penicillium pulvis]KAJ5786412.1 hypothetical protein N7503_011624 [Penicillium pulvis]
MAAANAHVQASSSESSNRIMVLQYPSNGSGWNGFVDAGGLPTREEWQSACNDMDTKASPKRKQKKGHRKRDWKPKPSGLREVTTFEPHDSAPNLHEYGRVDIVIQRFYLLAREKS